MITLKKLKWGNLFSYGDNNEIDFTQDTLTQILGVNGNGKSSIALILEEALYNKNSKGIKKADIPNRHTDSGYWLELSFGKDEDDYLVRLDRKSSIKIKLFKNEEDISSHTATATFKQIEDIMEIDFKMFSQLVYQNTNSSLQFLVATDTNRKRFLIDLLKLDEYVAFFELFKDTVKEHANNVAKIQGKVETVDQWLNQNKLSSIEEMEVLDTDGYETYEEEREIARISLEIANIDKTNRAIANNCKYKELLKKINIEEIQAIQVEPTKSYDDEQSELGGLTSERTRKLAYIKKIEGLGDTCPTCEQTVTPEFKTGLVADEKAEVVQLDAKIADIKAAIESIKANNTRYLHKKEKIKEWEELYASINNSLPSEPITKDDLEGELTNLGLKVSNTKEKLRAVMAQNQIAAKHNSKISVVLEQSEQFQKELETYSEQLETEKKNLATLELLKKSFSTSGLIAYKIENQVKELEELANEYLAELSDGKFTIEFSVDSDKLNVIITDEGRQVEIQALSSGELARVNTSTLLALRKLMNSISKSKINVLFLDEVVSVLDDPGKEKLVEVLLKEDLNTFIVSHGWQHPLLAKLEIVKEDNVSRIERE